MKILLNPNILAFFVGLAMFLTGFRLPEGLFGLCSNLADFTTPLAMLVAGMLLGEFQVSQLKQFTRLPLVLAFRLILIPLMILFLAQLQFLLMTAKTGAAQQAPIYPQ